MRNGHDIKTLQNSFEKKTCGTNNNNNNNNTNKKQTVNIPWVPKIGPKIKKEIQKFGFRVAFQTGTKLKNIHSQTTMNLIFCIYFYLE